MLYVQVIVLIDYFDLFDAPRQIIRIGLLDRIDSMLRVVLIVLELGCSSLGHVEVAVDEPLRINLLAKASVGQK